MSAETLRKQVLKYIASRGVYGATDEEVQRALRLPGNTQRPRRLELRDRGLIEQSADRRIGASGRSAAVWVVPPPPPAPDPLISDAAAKALVDSAEIEACGLGGLVGPARPTARSARRAVKNLRAVAAREAGAPPPEDFNFLAAPSSAPILDARYYGDRVAFNRAFAELKTAANRGQFGGGGQYDFLATVFLNPTTGCRLMLVYCDASLTAEHVQACALDLQTHFKP
jgi:hypothetical protein